MKRLLALAFVLLPGGAAEAQVLPSLYDVTRVGPSSVLNVRAGPGTGSPVIGTLAPDAKGVEVVAIDQTGGWGQLNLREGAGWSSLRFLAEQPEVWAPGSLPPGLACLGTEPFWSLRVENGALVLETPEARREPGTLTALDTGVPGDVRRALFARDARTRVTAAITPQACSDGMSDRAFGLGAMVVLEDEEAASMLLTGCCSIAP